MTSITPIAKGNIKAISTEIKNEGILTSRPDGLRVSFDALVTIDGFNYRAIDRKHVEQLKIALANGQKPATFLVQPVETENGKRFGIIGGHHTQIAIGELIEEGHPKYTKDTLLDCDAVFPKNAAHAQLMAFNHNQGKTSDVLENARFFRSQMDEGLDLNELHLATGISKSVICNTLKILEGDSELIALVESKQISASKARGFINKYGAEKATAYAKSHIAMKTQKKNPDVVFENTAPESLVTTTANSVSQENNTTTQAGVSSSEQTEQEERPTNTRLAAKSHNAGLTMRSLTSGQSKECEKLITQMASRLGDDGTISLPAVLVEQLKKMHDKIKEVDEHNERVIQELDRLK